MVPIQVRFWPPALKMRKNLFPVSGKYDKKHLVSPTEKLVRRIHFGVAGERQELAKAIDVPVENLDFTLVEDGPEHWAVIETNSKRQVARIGHPFR